MNVLDPSHLTLESVSRVALPKALMNKYIVISVNGIETVVPFQPHLQHAAMVPRHYYRDLEVVSAGFYDVLPDGTVFVTGESTSLEVSSRPIDADLIAAFLKG